MATIRDRRYPEQVWLVQGISRVHQGLERHVVHERICISEGELATAKHEITHSPDVQTLRVCSYLFLHSIETRHQ